MILHTIWIQYPCAYPGEYAPQVYEAVDENLLDENPPLWRDKIAEVRAMVAKGEIDSYRVIRIKLDEDAVKHAFDDLEIAGEV